MKLGAKISRFARNDVEGLGGCWNGIGFYCRSAGRGYGDPSDTGNDLGFRLSR